MAAYDLFVAAFLGLIEGLTEFIPVSSTGHLIFFTDILQFAPAPGHVFEVVIQFGAIAAVCVLYRQKLWNIARGLTHDRAAQKFTFNLFLAFLPAAILGFLFHGFIKSHLFQPMVVGCSLIIGGLILLWVDKRIHASTITDTSSIAPPTAFKIGLFQAIAMIPGVSRSGATIVGGLFNHLDRKTAAEFSFFLAIPTMLAAALYDLYKNRDLLTDQSMMLIAIGFMAAFLSAMVVVRGLIGFVSKHGFAPFAYYRIIFGAIILASIYAGYA